jgi:hypothetical protein
MPYLFNFDRHVNKIIGHQLKSHGFVRKGMYFYRFVGKYYKETIHFQASAWNGRFNPYNMYYINMFLTRDDFIKDREQVAHERILDIPLEFFEGEKRVMDRYPDCYWQYVTEEDLIESLKRASCFLDRGLQYFNKVEKTRNTKRNIKREELDEIYDTLFRPYRVGKGGHSW